MDFKSKFLRWRYGIDFEGLKETASAYKAGQKAHDEGIDLCRNPYIFPESRKKSFSAWMAGWMYAKHLSEDKKNEST